jgi:hypothetical protein
MFRSFFICAMCAAVVVLSVSSTRAQTVSSIPVGYWNFDDENAADSSGNGLNGTLVGGATFATDVPPELGGGNSLQLASGITADGTGDYVDLGTPSLLEFGAGDFTIAGWIKSDQAGRGNFFSNGGDDGGGIRYVLALGETNDAARPGALTLTTDDNVTKVQAIGNAMVNDGQWHHIAAVREATAIRVYLDGVEEASNTVPAGYDLTGVTQKNAYIGVGISAGDAVNFQKQLGGLYDDVAIWNVALPDSDILGLSNGTLSVLADGGAPMLGDFNEDGVVNVMDYNILSDNLAGHLDGPVGREQGDLNFDGDVDLDDFGQFKELFPGAAGQAQGIPEPASVTLLLVAVLALCCATKCRRPGAGEWVSK